MASDDDTRSRLSVGWTAGAIVVCLLALYVLGFFVLGTVGSTMIGPRSLRLRIYHYRWQAVLFRPLTRLESALTGQEVETASRN
jgi:hypothetical protein